MTELPESLKAEIAADPFYLLCARQEALHDHVCLPNPGMVVEPEIVIYQEGNPIYKRFSAVPLCQLARSGRGAIRAVNVWIALNRATTQELLEISRHQIDYFRARADLNKIFGEYIEPMIHTIPIDIKYPWLKPEKVSV